MKNITEHRNEVMKSLFAIVKDKGYSQQELAAEIDLKQANLSRMKNGKYSPNLDNILKICEVLGLTIKFEPNEQRINH